MTQATSSAAVRWTWQPYAIVFISNACIMILELVAGRIVAPYIGVSLYTWTSIIGIVLAGISLGNYLGGRLADQRGSQRLLGWLFLLSGLTSFGVLAADWIGRGVPASWPTVLQILVVITTLFFVPCVVLGTISPVVAKLAVRDLAKTGATVGKIYAAGTVGSIVGTFATGFVLISLFGTTAIVWGVALVLIGMGLLFLLRGAGRGAAVAVFVVVLGLTGAQRAGWLQSRCTKETNYFCIKVRDDVRDGKPMRVLTLDRLVHSFSSLEDPTELVYGYEQLYAQLVRYWAHDSRAPRALFIGGGGYTFPRYLEAVYPASQLDVIEIDPGVTQVAYELLGVAADSRIRTFNEDARTALRRSPLAGERYDIIMGDAFNDFSVPYHLTTREFDERVRAWLADDGLYLVNIIDGPQADFLRAYVHTLQQSFPYVYLAPTNSAWRKSPRSTFVVIAANAPLDLKALTQASSGTRNLADLLLRQTALADLLAEQPALVLTDQFAPVEQLLAPAFRNQTAAAGE